MHPHRRRAQARRTPNVFVDLICGEILSAVLHQKEEDIELGRRQRNGPAPVFHGALVGIHRKGPKGDHRLRLGQKTHRDMRFEKPHGTGLHHIIRRPRGEARENGVLAVQRGQNDDGRELGEDTEELQPHAVFEDEVQDDCVEAAFFGQDLNGLIHIACRKHDIVLGKVFNQFPQ